MSLDDFQLSPFLMQRLYKKSLFDLEILQSENESQQTPAIPFLGKNEKNMLVLVSAPGTAFLPDASLSLLVGILTACNLSLADIALVNTETSPGLTYKNLMEEFMPKAVFLFGIPPASLEFPLHFPHFQLQHYNEQVYISAPALDALASDKEMKKSLWSSLQQYFANN